jgi:hypothetical protein
MDKDTKLFDDKSFSDLLRDVYNNTKKKQGQVDILIDQLKPLIKTTHDAPLIVPLLKEYLEISVKNDDNLVRLTGIIQRLLAASNKTEEGELTLSDAERRQLLQEAETIMNKD